MNKTLMIGVGVVLAAGLGWYVMGNKDAGNGGYKGTGESKMEEFSGDLQSAMMKNVPLKCEWSDEKGNKGVSYVQGENVYAETTMEGKMGYVMKKGDCTYTWGQEEGKGIKICLDEEQTTEIAGQAGTEVNYKSEGKTEDGLDYGVDYKCGPAIFGGEKFEAPTNIEFTDFGAMMEGALEQFKGMTPDY